MFKKIILTIKHLFKNFFQKLSKKPFLTVGALMGVFFVLLLIGAFLRKPAKDSQTKEKKPISVSVFTIGSVPKIKIQAKVEKDKLIKIVSQTSGIVNSIFALEGQEVYIGNALAYISTNYWGGNSFSIQKQIAKANLDNINTVYPLQIELISKQKEIAEKTDSNNDELRNISSLSLSETKDLLTLNEEILNTLNLNLESYNATNSSGANNTLILSTKQLKSQYQTAINSLKSSIRNLEYQTDGNEFGAVLSNLSRETVMKQLEIQEKTLNLSKEVASLQYNLAVVNEGLAYPSAPFLGKVEKVHVKIGQNVNSSTVLFTLSGYSQNISLSALVSQRTANLVSLLEPSQIYIRNNKYELYPKYISSEAVEGTLYMIKYDLSEISGVKLTEGEYLEVNLPLGYPDTSKTSPFIPIDSVYQTGDGAYVYLAGDKNTARAKKIKLGEVYGQFVEVIDGLTDKDRVILDRNVVSGDKISVN